MGISRMIGVDSTLGDPNAFGASIVYSLPIAVALWRSGIGGRRGKVLIAGYAGLASMCVLLTGSRSSLLGLLLCSLIVVWGTRYRLKALAALVVVSPLAFVALPESLQTRFETIINPEVGPKNAQESGEGRIEGLTKGFALLQANPFTGIGPGAWRPATRSKIEAHNLYGQMMGELGLAGIAAFSLLIACFWMNLRQIRRLRLVSPDHRTDFVFQLCWAVGVGLFLLLFMGNFGHNLFRFTWLWYGGFLIIARHCVAVRVAQWEAGADVEQEHEPVEEPALPQGWILHPPHVQ
jgi:O-antigen ligase